MNIANTAPTQGMNAANFRADNAARNAANADPVDFRAQRVGRDEAAAREVAQSPRTDRSVTDTYEAGTGAATYAAETEGRDITRDMTDMINQRNTYAANAENVRMQNETAGTTIDLVG